MKPYKSINLNNKTLFPHPTFKGDNLGNIRDTHIKSIAIELVKKYPDQFKFDDFQHNKEKVEEFAETSSKLMRNKIAGYITRYLASRNKRRSTQLISE